MSAIFIDGQLAHYEVIGRGNRFYFYMAGLDPGGIGFQRCKPSHPQTEPMLLIFGALEIVPKTIATLLAMIRWSL